MAAVGPISIRRTQWVSKLQPQKWESAEADEGPRRFPDYSLLFPDARDRKSFFKRSTSSLVSLVPLGLRSNRDISGNKRRIQVIHDFSLTGFNLRFMMKASLRKEVVQSK
jgi:hypothetical protein